MMNEHERMTKKKTSAQKHILLTSLGINQPCQTIYELKDAQVKGLFSALALWALTAEDRRSDEIWFLMTPETLERWQQIQEEAQQLGASVQKLEIAGNEEPNDVFSFLNRVANEIPKGSRLTLDVTQGLRHHAFLFYALALYISAFREVLIDSAWYCRWEISRDEDAPRPFIDLKPVLELAQWFYAVRMFQETGFSKALAARFDALKNALPQDHSRGPAANMTEALRDFSHHYESGLPLELGLAAGRLSHELEQQSLDSVPGMNLPLARDLGDAILEAAMPYRLESDGLKDGMVTGDWKKQYSLNKEELQRQATLIDRYLERDQLSEGVRLMREWVVSMGVLHRGDPASWLDRSARVKIERELGAISQPALRKGLSDEQKGWGKFWDQLGNARNQFAHQGIKQEVARLESTIKKIRPCWDDIKSADRIWTAFGGGGGRLLITPLGMSPGVLYSAMQQTDPNVVLLLCSEQANPGIEEALRQTGYSGPRHVLEMRDPFNGFEEIKELLSQARKVCLGADEVVVNLTGGTTMLGIAVQQLFEQARDDQRPSRRFVLTDMRTMEDQKNDPWVVSDIYWLDKVTDEETDND